MKKILSLGLALMLFGAASQAQSTDTATASGRHKMHRHSMTMRADMAKKLNLTADQQTKMKTLQESFKQERQGIKDNADLSADQKKQAYKDLFKKNNTARRAILTPEQQAIIKESRKTRRANHPHRRKAMRSQQATGK